MTSHPPDVTATSEDLIPALRRLTAAGRCWLAVAPPAVAVSGWPGEWRDDVTVFSMTPSRDVPVTVNPFEPAPGAGVQAHADRLAALIEASFRPPGPVRAVIRLALRRVYDECGWDPVTGTGLPGAAAPPCVPSLSDLRRAAHATLADLGRDERLGVTVRGFLDARLGSLWSGPAGRYLAGGHPADLSAMLDGKAVATVGDVTDDEAAAFLAGVLLIRLVEHARVRLTEQAPGDRPAVLVIALPGSVTGRLRGLLDDLRSAGTEVIRARYVPAKPDAQAQPAEPPDTARDTARDTGRDRGRDSAAAVPMLGRRSVACGLQCRQRPCSGRELHAAGLLARGDAQVWFRLWGETLVLAFLTGRPLPRVPAPVRRSWPSLDARTRECLLATVVDDAVAARALALRHSYEPRRLIAAVASTAAGLLAAATTSAAGSAPLPAAMGSGAVRAGQVWVIPQLRWLHETERLCPPGQHRVNRDDIAPPLDFELAGLADWPGIRAGDRLDALRRHRLSMDYAPNRAIAATALHGTGDGAGSNTIARDLALAGIGLSPRQRLRHAARILGTTRFGQHSDEPSWLEVVLSWPDRTLDGMPPAALRLGGAPAVGTG